MSVRRFMRRNPSTIVACVALVFLAWWLVNAATSSAQANRECANGGVVVKNYGLGSWSRPFVCVGGTS